MALNVVCSARNKTKNNKKRINKFSNQIFAYCKWRLKKLNWCTYMKQQSEIIKFIFYYCVEL